MELAEKVLIFLIVVVFIIEIYQNSQFKHLPGPIYGGDIYRERGVSQHIINGNPPWSDQFFANEYAFLPWLYYLLVALFKIAINSSLTTASIFFPVIYSLFSVLIFYYLGIQFFNSKKFALLLVITIFSVYSFTHSPKTFGWYVTLPLFLATWITFEKNGQTKFKFFAGIALGLVALTHTTVFIGALIVFTFSIFVLYVEKLIKSTAKKEIVLEFLGKYIPIFILAFIVSSPFFLPIALKYNFKILNNSNEYALTDVSLFTPTWLIVSVVSLFLDFSDLPHLIFGFCAIVGLWYCYKKKELEEKILLLIFMSIVLASALHFITIPLINRFILTPSHIFSNIRIPFYILGVFGLKYIVELITSTIKKGNENIILLGIVFIVLIPFFVSNYFLYNNDKWVQYGKTLTPETEFTLEVGNWILNNTNNHDIFLANDESAFMITALTGRKVVFVRRVHASYFVDVNKRYADGIVMFYGNDTETVKELLVKYNVKYVYIDFFLFNYPIITSLEHENYLKENGVNFSVEEVRWDPSTDIAPKFKSVVVRPQNIGVLSQFLIPVKEFKLNNQTAAVLYKVII